MTWKDIMARSLDYLQAIVEALGFASSGFFVRKALQVKYGTITLAGNATGTLSIQMPSESAVVVEKLLAESTGTYNCRISRSDTNLMITDGYIPDTLLFQVAADPANGMNIPFYLNKQAILRLEITDTSGASNTINAAAYIRYIEDVVN